MLSGYSSSSPLRHCCMVPSGTCHWQKYLFLIACASHLSFLVVVFSFIMVWIVWPSIELGRGRGVLPVIAPCGSVCWVELVKFMGGGGGGDIINAC